jgi:transcriptional regulator with XRE-family HTH domain
MRREEGRRFERFVRERWQAVGGRGGIRGLCRAAGITPEAIYKWFRGDTYPDMATLAEMARILMTTRVELVAAMDNEPAPMVSIRHAVHEELTPLIDAVQALTDEVAAAERREEPQGYQRRTA